MVQLNLNLTHACLYTHVKVYNLVCISFIACDVVHTHAIKHLWHTRHAPRQQIRHECTSSKPYIKTYVAHHTITYNHEHTLENHRARLIIHCIRKATDIID